MNEQQVFSTVVTIVRDQLDNDDLQLSMDAVPAEIQGWDSLAHVGIVVAVEREFRLRFNTEQVERLANVGDLVRLVQTASVV